MLCQFCSLVHGLVKPLTHSLRKRQVLLTQIEVLCGEINDAQSLLEDWFDFIRDLEDDIKVAGLVTTRPGSGKMSSP